LEIFGILNFFAKLKPDSLALADDSSEITFLQLESNVRRIARLLQNNEIDSSSLVCTMLPSVLDWQVTLALHMLGAGSFSKPMGSKLDQTLMPDWLVSTQLNPNFPEERTFVIDDNFEKAVNQTERLRSAPGFFSPNAPARYFFTSGTSGEPKYLAISASEIMARYRQQGSSELVGEREVLNLSKFGSTQNYRIALRALFDGRTFYCCDFFDYKLPKILSKYPIRTVAGSPVQVSSLIDSLIQTGSKAPRVQTIVMGGSAPTQTQIKRVREHFNARIFNSYGSTELGFVSLHEIVEGKIMGGNISPEVKLEIVDSENRKLNNGESGIVRYAKINMATEYYKSLDATKEFFQDHFFYPGDSGFLDNLGRLHITGRTNEVMNLGGVKVSPNVVEEIALSVAGIEDAAAFSLTDNKGIDRLVLAYVKSSGFNLVELEEKFKSELKAISVAKFVDVDEIPRNENGKIPRSNLAQLIFVDGNRSD
jgi:long-chain acyl-CoA synthetase